MARPEAPVEAVAVQTYTVPTDFPESDGTLEWDKTTLVVVESSAGGMRGLGYTYADNATAVLINTLLAGVVLGRSAMDIQGAWTAMVHSIRNLGRPGISSMAIAAVDNSLWDLKARLLKLPLVKLLGAERSSVLAYGSGGFTSYSEKQLCKQLGNWASHGFKAVKMKVGRRPDEDIARVRAARRAVGPGVQLFVDANGSYTPGQAHYFAEKFAELGVNWFEEPVSSDDLRGLRFIRDHAPSGMEIAAGEYGYDLVYFQRMLDAGAVHVLQADASRCAGITEFLRVGAICDAHLTPLSAHTAPSLHLHLCCALPAVRHVEYFHDHARIENMFFDGASNPIRGMLAPDLTRPGLGLELKVRDAAKYAA